MNAQSTYRAPVRPWPVDATTVRRWPVRLDAEQYGYHDAARSGCRFVPAVEILHREARR